MAWGVEFDAVNVLESPDAKSRLRELGIPAVPATVVGGRVVHGWNPEGLAELVGVPYEGVPPLAPAELAERLEEILSMTQYALQRAPAAGLERCSPGRNRNVRDLGYHVFRVAEAFVDAIEQGYLPESWLFENAPEHLRGGGDLASHGKAVRARLADWFASAPAPGYGHPVETYYGTQTVHALLERTAWHCGQHLRQVWALLAEGGTLPAEGLDSAVFAGLPMPEALW